jgi:hypothetical protein
MRTLGAAMASLVTVTVCGPTLRPSQHLERMRAWLQQVCREREKGVPWHASRVVIAEVLLRRPLLRRQHARCRERNRRAEPAPAIAPREGQVQHHVRTAADAY